MRSDFKFLCVVLGGFFALFLSFPWLLLGLEHYVNWVRSFG